MTIDEKINWYKTYLDNQTYETWEESLRHNKIKEIQMKREQKND